MKRWIKRHSKKLIIIFGSAVIVNSIYGIVNISPGKEWQLLVYSLAIMLWLVWIFVVTGVHNRIFAWWDRD